MAKATRPAAGARSRRWNGWLDRLGDPGLGTALAATVCAVALSLGLGAPPAAADDAPVLREVEQDITREAESSAAEAAPSGAALISIAGIDTLLSPLEDGVRQQLTDAKLGFSREQIDHIAEVYDKAALSAVVAQHLDERLSDTTRRGVARFYRSPLGERIARLESEGAAALQDTNTRHTSAILAISADLDDQPERVALLRQMIAAVNAIEVGQQMIRATTGAMLQGIAVADGTPLDAEALDAALDRELSAVWGLVEEFDRLTFAWIYREAETEDLASYLTFLEGEDGRAFYAAAYAAIIDGLEDASFDLGKRLGESAKEQPT